MKLKQFSTDGRALLSAEYIDEPLLTFGHGRTHPDPKVGISAFGPSSMGDQGKHPTSIHVGFVGTPKTLGIAKRWLEESVEGIPGTDVDLEFPGCTSDIGFFTSLVFDKNWVEELTQNDLSRVLESGTQKAQFSECVDLLEEKVRLLAGRDQSPTLVILALPDELLERYRTIRYVENRRRVVKSLRCVLKARTMRYGVPTQIPDLLTHPVAQGVDWSRRSGVASLW